MGLRKFLFGDKTEIKKAFDAPFLGKMVWDEDEESWKGSYNDMEIYLSFECGQPKPTNEIINYASSVLSNMKTLEAALEHEKEKFKSQYKNHHEEIDALRYSYILFYRYKSKYNRIIAGLEPGRNDRAWRIEFNGAECEGIGFDS